MARRFAPLRFAPHRLPACSGGPREKRVSMSESSISSGLSVIVRFARPSPQRPACAKLKVGSGSRAGEGRMNDLGQAAVSADKAPRTERGRRTVRKLLEAAAQEFGQRGYHEAAITGITAARRRRARHLLHLFREQGGSVPGAGPRHEPGDPRPCRRGGARRARTGSPPSGSALPPSSPSRRRHPELYRIIEEAQFVAEDVYREHYLTFVDGYRRNLAAAERARRDRAKGRTSCAPGR